MGVGCRQPKIDIITFPTVAENGGRPAGAQPTETPKIHPSTYVTAAAPKPIAS